LQNFRNKSKDDRKKGKGKSVEFQEPSGREALHRWGKVNGWMGGIQIHSLSPFPYRLNKNKLNK
jgi:hypothetical protein